MKPTKKGIKYYINFRYSDLTVSRLLYQVERAYIFNLSDLILMPAVLI